MQKLVIYHLGAEVDIKTSPNSDKVVAFLYTKGKSYATKMLKMKTANVSMPKNDRLRMAGIRVVEDESEFNACCYAKTLFEKIEAERRRGGTVYAKNVAEALDKELKKRPLPYFINAEADAEDKKLAEHAIVGAKAFVSLKESEKEEIFNRLIRGDQQISM